MLCLLWQMFPFSLDIAEKQLYIRMATNYFIFPNRLIELR